METFRSENSNYKKIAVIGEILLLTSNILFLLFSGTIVKDFGNYWSDVIAQVAV